MILQDIAHATLAQMSMIPPWALLLLKATLLLAAAWAIHFGLARANPRWRTLLWRGSALGLMLLIVWTFGLPGLAIPIDMPATPPQTSLAVQNAPANAPQMTEDPIVPSSVTLTPTFRPDPPQSDEAASGSAEAAASPLPLRMILLCIWGFGAMLLIGRLAIGYVSIAGILKRSSGVSDHIEAEVRQIAADLGCRRSVTVRSSERFNVPFLYGLRRPILVLPKRMCEPAYRSQLPGVIAHELAHVRANDFGWNAILQAESVLLWFHPLAWRIVAAHRAAYEAVCDAVSASYLGDAQAYCRTLAKVALDGAGVCPAAGLAMARVCDVRRRIAVLERHVFDSPLRRRAVFWSTSIAILVLASLAGVRLALADISDKSSDESNRPLDPEEGRRAFEQRLKQAEMTKPGHVTDLSNRPIAGAVVKCANKAWTATTDANGSFTLPELKQGEWVNWTVSAPGFLTLDHTSFGRDQNGAYRINGEWPIRLPRVANISGRVLGPDGNPLAGAPVSIDTSVRMPQYSCTTGNYRETVTDTDGRFTLKDIPPGSHAIYYPSHAAQSIPAKGVYGSLIVEPKDGQELNDLTIDLSQSTAGVEGQVLGPDGNPLAGTAVMLSRLRDWKEGNLSNSQPSGPNPSSKTDAQGRFKLTGIGPGQWQLLPSHPNYQRRSPTQRITLAAKQSLCQDLRVTLRNDAENNYTRAAAESEHTDDLRKIDKCYHSVNVPVVTQNLDQCGQLTFLSLAPGQIDDARVELKSIGMSRTAAPEEVAKTAHIGEFYFLAPNKLVTVNGTIVAPFTPPGNEPHWDFPGWQKPMKRAELVKQVEASRRKNPDADGRRVTIEDDNRYIVVRDDGKAFLMFVRNVTPKGFNPSFLYLGHLKLAKQPDAKSKAKP